MQGVYLIQIKIEHKNIVVEAVLFRLQPMVHNAGFIQTGINNGCGHATRYGITGITDAALTIGGSAYAITGALCVTTVLLLVKKMPF